MHADCHIVEPGSPFPVAGGRSWNDLESGAPRDPMELIAWANIPGSAAAFTRSAAFFSETWIDSPFAIDSMLPACQALGADSQQNIADAVQWNFGHATARIDSSTPPCLRKLLFLRAGVRWLNVIPIDLGIGGEVYNDMQLSFLENAATRGDCQGAVPVISFSGGDLSGRIMLEVVLKQPGRCVMGLRAVDSGNNVSMFEMEWVVV